jgi:rhomboid protease GluP
MAREARLASFGRRSSVSAFAPALGVAAAAPTPVIAAVPAKRTTFPYLSLGIFALLAAVFAAEQIYAPSQDMTPNLAALKAFGAIDAALVIGEHQWWRIFTAPLLHGNLAHILGNGVALLLAGWMLERIIGRAWFAAIYWLGGIGGAFGSMVLSGPDVLSVGASGAIMALVTASFVASFHDAAGGRGRWMRGWSLFLLIPALAPLASDGSHIDVGAHFGGALAGLAFGIVLPIFWPEDAELPQFRRAAAGVSLGAASLSLASFAFAMLTFHIAPESFDLMPQSAMPATVEDGVARSNEFITRYPRDPRAHLFHAMRFLGQNDFPDAEQQLRIAIAETARQGETLPAGFAKELNLTLALTLIPQGRSQEARLLAAPDCQFAADTPEFGELHDTLKAHGVCP